MNRYWILDFYDCFEEIPNITRIEALKLFHYTSKDKKEKMLGNDKLVLWFSRADKFLDKNEGAQILEPYYYACGELYDKEVIDNKFYTLLKGIEDKDLKQNISNKWVICFSSDGSSQDMKSRYAPLDGYVLGFNMRDVYRCCDKFNREGTYICLENVCYEQETMRRYFINGLKEVYNRYSKAVVGKKNDEVIIMDARLREYLIRSILEHALVYKSSDYAYEKEIRLICEVGNGFNKWEDKENGCLIQMRDVGKTPQLEIQLPKDRLIIESQELVPYQCTELNKAILTREEIRKYSAVFEN